jgi:NADPH:quinone reductase-like Zn-dependent oxidoreductase/3-oxoacyl-(acyl-carrier-protein) synthase
VLVISDDERVQCKRLSLCVSHDQLVTALRNVEWAAIAVAVATQQGCLSVLPLFALEVALTLVQTQMTMSATSKVWLITSGSRGHAGSWGLARSAKAETSLPLVSMSLYTRTLPMALRLGPALTEPEVALHERNSYGPRLKLAPPSVDGLVRLHFHARGAMSNLFIEPLPAFPPIDDADVILRVRAVGLNFRDVLNVLGEYPGDPGPPGGDAAGVVGEAPLLPHSAFGLGHAPLASVAITALPFLAGKPSTLSFEQACTLPITWSTTHAAVERAGLRAGSSMIVQAAAGGVGLKAVEYVQWLGASPVGTAGRPHKLAQLRATGVVALCSSRDGAALTMGVTRHLAASRSQAVLNSLSLDFIAASFASLCEGGAFEEIGKRGIWASGRHCASSTTTSYCAIALDVDMALNPSWMGAVLALLAARARADALTSLPLRSFDMEAQHELAFRTLQSGLNTGKIVVRIMARTMGCDGVHVVTGGTGGLGLLTGRWLAQCDARSLYLASRSGTLAKDTGVEWEAIESSGATPTLERCDTGEAVHVIRLVARASSLSGVWHAAGALADALLPRQDAPGLNRVYAPKAFGAWSLHMTSVATSMHAFALFSSVATLLGGAGQANYAAANACLDALATSRRAHAVVAASVQWGAWAEVGMAARGAASERMASMEAASGMARITLAMGLRALGTAVNHGSSSVLGMLPVTWSRFLGAGEVPAFLSTFASKAKNASMVGAGTASPACCVSLEAILDLVQRTAGGSVNADAPLMEAGVDSLGAVELRNQLQGAAGHKSLPSTLVFDHPTARQLASVLQPKQSVIAVSITQDCLASATGTVAVDGLSALLSAGASSPQMASRSVACGCDAMMQVPAARWDVHAQPALPEPMASRVRYNGFVCGAELVDHAVFAVSPAETAAMDPCQRLVLEFGYAALHDAPLDRMALGGSLTGIFLGFTVPEFGQVLIASPAGGSVYAATGASPSIAAGRLSYTLGLHGPCASYDTACSAALAAGHAGLRALQLDECVVGLVVGVTLMLAPGVGTSFAVAGMTSARGRSHTFDGRADGYARGEACGGVALRGGLRHRAVPELFGSAVRQDGRSASLTAPNGQAQQGLLVAALQDASTSVDTLTLNEAHGTGTKLGDPIEASSLASAVLLAREGALAVGGVKANIGHAEPAAGMTGLLKLAIGLQVKQAAPNAQLRLLNPHVGDTLRGVAGALPVQLAAVTVGSGGVSSFGYSGTIAHAVLRHAGSDGALAGLTVSLTYRRRAFPWRDPPHPFVQRTVPASDGAVVFQSPAAIALHALVSNHVVQGRVIFPAAGYLEVARAAGATALCAVYFLQPLVAEVPGLVVECAVSDGRFEVRSSESVGLEDATVHCSGAAATGIIRQRVDHASLRTLSRAADVAALYDGFDAVGLQYGPGYRTLINAWGGANDALARLRARSTHEGTQVHPADLDDALCTSGAMASSGGGETRLPFAVDDAMLQGNTGELWVVRALQPCPAPVACLPLSVACSWTFAGCGAARDGGGGSETWRLSGAASSAARRFHVARAAIGGVDAAPSVPIRVALNGCDVDTERCDARDWVWDY